MLDYILKNIDDELWKDFKAVAALQGKTVRQKLLSYIHDQGRKLTAMVICKDKLKSSSRKEALKK